MTRKKFIICLIVLVAAALPALVLNTLYGYLAVLTAALLIAGSYGYLRLLRRSLEYREMSDFSNCVRGTNIDFSVRLKNHSPLFYPRVEPFFYLSDLFGGADSVTSDIITLAPAEERKFGFDVRFDHIGTYSAGLQRVEMEDLLGLFSTTVENPRRQQVVVAPRIYDVAQLQISRTAVTESDKMLVPNPMDSTDYTGVREYVIGDPMKNIHWKISARTEGYVTKIFESYTNTGISIILDFHAPVYDRETLMSVFDSIVETALSVGIYAADNGLESELLYYDKRDERVKVSDYERDSFPALVESMPRIYTERRRVDAVDLLREEGNALYSQGNLAICTASLSPDLIETLLQIKNRRKNPMLFAIVPDLYDSEEERQQAIKPLRVLEDAGISYYVLAAAEELQKEGAAG